MRPLFLALLSAIGFAASPAEPRVAQRSIAQVVQRVAQQRGIAGLAADDAPPACVPQAITCARHTFAKQSAGSDFTGVVGSGPAAWARRNADESLPTPDTPAVGTSTRRRQPEGRAPPRGSIAA